MNTTFARRVGWLCPTCGFQNEPDDFTCDSGTCRAARHLEENGPDPTSCLNFGVLALIPRVDVHRAAGDQVTGFIIKDGDGDVVAIIPRNGRTVCVTSQIAQHIYDVMCGRKRV